MELLKLLIIVLTIASFLWMARSDYRHLDAKIDSIQEEMKGFHRAMAETNIKISETNSRIEKMDAEFKNFMMEEERKRTKILTGR